MSPIILSSALLLLFQAEEPGKLTLAVTAERTNGKWTATISGKIPDTKLNVVNFVISGRREHLDKGTLLPIAWENPIRRKARVERGSFTLRQEFERADSYDVEVILSPEKRLTSTIRVGTSDLSVPEAAAQVKRCEELFDLADKALEKFGKAADQPDRDKAVVKPFEDLRDAEAKLTEIAPGTYHAAAVDETVAALHEAIMLGSWIINVSKKKPTKQKGADMDGAGGDDDKPQGKTKDVSKISVADLRAKVKEARAALARETALWTVTEYIAALRIWADRPKDMEIFAKGLKSAREKLGQDFVKDFEPSKVSSDTISGILKSAEAFEVAVRKP